jgi:hypothetical protein
MILWYLLFILPFISFSDTPFLATKAAAVLLPARQIADHPTVHNRVVNYKPIL